VSKRLRAKQRVSADLSGSEAAVRSEGTERGTAASDAVTISPPYSNRRVYPSRGRDENLAFGSMFDAYCSTVFDEPKWLIDQLIYDLSAAGEKPTCAPGPPVRFYGENALLLDEFGKRLCSVRWGGANGYPFVECKGAASPVIAETLRREFDHRPARLDAALDRSAPKLFERYVRITRKLAKAYGLRLEPKGDWITPDAGRTIMLGSRYSQVVLRVYEKGLELAGKQDLELTDELRFLVRAEVEFKPQNQTARKRASTIAPQALWGLTAWLVDFANKAFNIDAARVKVTERREADYARALRFMAQQYRAHLRRLLDEHGGDLEDFAQALLVHARLHAGE